MDNLIYGDMYKKDPYVRMRFEQGRNMLLPHLKEKVSILDVGCYTADLLNILPEGIEYYGIDTDDAALKIAQEKGARVFRIDLEREDLSSLALPKFDIIVATEILEHLKDPQRLLTQIKDLLRDDGIALLSLPNECTIYHRLKVLFGKGIDGTGFAPHYHLHFPTMRQNEELIGKNFKVLKRKYWVHLETAEAFLAGFLKMIPLWFWLFLADLQPSLFARGVIYLCQK